jgi:hypothetical protein
MFMASGGDDGLVKIWSCRPFVSAAHHTAQLTYGAMRNGGSARVTSLTVCDSSHSGAWRAGCHRESELIIAIKTRINHCRVSQKTRVGDSHQDLNQILLGHRESRVNDSLFFIANNRSPSPHAQTQINFE